MLKKKICFQGDASTTTDDGMIQNYTITYDNTNWSFETFSMARCIPGFAFYRRSNIDWCMAIGSTTGANTSFSRREPVCEKYGSSYDVTVTVSGVASAEEVEGMAYQLNKLRERNGITSFNAFADAQRTDECQLTPTTADCMSINVRKCQSRRNRFIKVQGFHTVDKTVENFDCYRFMTDASAGATEGKQCMVMIMDGVNNGTVDFVEYVFFVAVYRDW
ncbi:hypothetical protein B9Z55_012449 [Caenorhabditis nigoni]|uniref:PAN-3 domain-containing protein n=1 Tax=Caenorhabditis nigoni TaxID=1611254 RepID=A0A2G5TX81_9PELO|nr:hypothetical protein B9Z55_012449 [Caenorhabditis nigoni]